MLHTRVVGQAAGELAELQKEPLLLVSPPSAGRLAPEIPFGANTHEALKHVACLCFFL